MRSRWIAALTIACLTATARAQVPYDPVAPQLGAFLEGSCGTVSNGDPCYYFAVVDDNGSHQLYFPFVDDRPSWSPDGRAVVSGWSDDIVVLSLPSGNVTNLTNNPASDLTPALSPDGSKIAFSSDRAGGGYDLYVMNADGSNVTRIDTGVGYASWPSWSPDNHRLAFNCADAPAVPGDICAINVDGSGFARLTNDPADDYDPAWSPDGTTIAFTTARFGDPELMLINATDGSGLTRLRPGMIAWEPNWSPDGQRIAFTSFDFDSGAYDIFIMNADGTNMTFVTWGVSPSWRPLTGVGVNNRPAASFTFTCTQTTCSFTSTSADSDGSIAAYGWDFGDGTKSSDPNPTHTFAGGAQYGVGLIVMDNAGAFGSSAQVVDLNKPPVAAFTYSCTGLTCTFDGSPSNDPDGTITWYSWEYNPGSGGSQTNTHNFSASGTYSVTLTVFDSGNAHASHTENVTVTGNAPPAASLAYSCANRTCNFDGSASFDSDGTIASYLWTFGDGATATGAIASHTYALGSYTFTLTVTDNAGATNSLSVTMTIANTPPTPSFTFTCTARTCSFNATASSDGDGTIVSYAWTFGDGTSGSGATTSHTYASVGIAPVTLTVTDNSSASAILTKTVTITNAPPAASFSFSCNGLTCNFNGSASSDSDGTIASYSWNFGDGATAMASTASHAYASSGNFTVTLTVTDNDGATGSASHVVAVPQAEVHVGDLDGATQRAGNAWNATVTITVHNASHNGVAGAVVSGTWSPNTPASCTTNATGQCSVSLSGTPNKTSSVTFTVTGVASASSTYRPANNHDPDGDSNGTTINVTKQ
jgi:PKD repeat protein